MAGISEGDINELSCISYTDTILQTEKGGIVTQLTSFIFQFGKYRDHMNML